MCDGIDGLLTEKLQFWHDNPENPEDLSFWTHYKNEMAIYQHIQQVDPDSTTPLASITPRMFGTSIDPDNRRRYIDMEYIEGIELGNLLGSATPEELRSYQPAVLHQLDLLHEAGIVHDDLNHRNIMIRTGVGCQDLHSRIVFIDFGSAIMRNSVSDEIWEDYKRQDRVILRSQFLCSPNVASPEPGNESSSSPPG